jgi:hypothetical protein
MFYVTEWRVTRIRISTNRISRHCATITRCGVGARRAATARSGLVRALSRVRSQAVPGEFTNGPSCAMLGTSFSVPFKRRRMLFRAVRRSRSRRGSRLRAAPFFSHLFFPFSNAAAVMPATRFDWPQPASASNTLRLYRSCKASREVSGAASFCKRDRLQTSERAVTGSRFRAGCRSPVSVTPLFGGFAARLPMAPVVAPRTIPKRAPLQTFRSAEHLRELLARNVRHARGRRRAPMPIQT